MEYRVFTLKDFEESHFRFAYEPFLFNKKEHCLLQPFQEEAYILVAISQQQIHARINVFIEKKVAYSPLLGTFGSIEFSTQLSYPFFFDFVSFVEAFCVEQNINSICIKSYPNIYSSQHSLLEYVLLQKGFEVLQTDLNQHIDLKKELITHISTKRRLNKCIKAGFTFGKWEQPNLKEVHSFVAKARLRKKFPMSLSWEAFNELFRQFPKAHQVFVVKDQQKIIALTVTISVNSKILYNFYPADTANYLNFSPTILLTDGLVKYAKMNKFEILDLGISTDKGVPNKGLIRFKQNLGSEFSLKKIYYKSYTDNLTSL